MSDRAYTLSDVEQLANAVASHNQAVAAVLRDHQSSLEALSNRIEAVSRAVASLAEAVATHDVLLTTDGGESDLMTRADFRRAFEGR